MKKKIKKKNKPIYNFLTLICLILMVGIAYFYGTKMISIYKMKEEQIELDKKLEDLKKKEAELKADVDRLQDPDYVARYAREKYLYTKDGEFVIKIPDSK